MRKPTKPQSKPAKQPKQLDLADLKRAQGGGNVVKHQTAPSNGQHCRPN
jgi:hypothetical protein